MYGLEVVFTFFTTLMSDWGGFILQIADEIPI